MKHHLLMQLLLGLILSLFTPPGYCKGKFSSFQEIDLEYDDDIDRSGDFIGDDDIKLSDQDYSENAVDASYKYSFNVIDDEEQVYQQQKQERDKGVVNGEYSWIDAAGTRHVTVYRADSTGYHIVEMREEKNVVEIREKPRKRKKNGSLKAKVTALRASKLNKNGRYNLFNDAKNDVPAVVRPAVVSPFVSKDPNTVLNNIDIPERVRSFAPSVENRVKNLNSNEPLIKAGISTSRSKSSKNKGRAYQNIGSGLLNGGFTIRNRPTVQREFELEEFSDFSESVSESPKKSGIKTDKNNFSQRRTPLAKKNKSPDNILGLIPTSKAAPDILNQIIPASKVRLSNNNRKSKINYVNLIPTAQLENPLKGSQEKSEEEYIDLVTPATVTSLRPRINIPILTKNERERTFSGLLQPTSTAKKLISDEALNEPDLSKGKPPIVISTTNVPISRNIPNPIFNNDNNDNIQDSLADIQKKKEEEIIAHIRRQLYEVIGQKRKASRLSSSAGNTKSAAGPKITGTDVSDILSKIFIKKNLPPTPKVLDDAPAEPESIDNLTNISKVDKNKRKRVRIVKHRQRKPSPLFANFNLVDTNKNNNGIKNAPSLLTTPPSSKTTKQISSAEILNRGQISTNHRDSNDGNIPNRRKKLLRVVKKLRPKKLRKPQFKNRSNKAPKQSHLSKSLLPIPSLNANKKDLLAEIPESNTLAKNVLLQAVLETENNAHGDVEESIKSNIIVTPKGAPRNDITITRVEKVVNVGPKVSHSVELSTPLVKQSKTVLPAPGSVALGETKEVKNSAGKIYTLPPRVLRPIGFVHPNFTL